MFEYPQLVLESNLGELDDAELISEYVNNIVQVIQGSVKELCSYIELSKGSVKIRVTDKFVDEVQALDPKSYPSGFTTERINGRTAAITQQSKLDTSEQIVIIDINFFLERNSIIHLPATISHEIAHCVLNNAYKKVGYPEGYVVKYSNEIEGANYVALHTINEFLADEIGELLYPPWDISKILHDSKGSLSDRQLNAKNFISSIFESCEKDIYPNWRNMVMDYGLIHRDLAKMFTPLSIKIQEGLTMSAHYRSFKKHLPKKEENEIERIEQHPGMTMYLSHLWDNIEDTFGTSVLKSLFEDFQKTSQELFDLAQDAVFDIWKTLGITFELLPDDRVYIHVIEPD